MTLFEQWNKRLSSQTVTEQEWNEYLAREKNFYQDLLKEAAGNPEKISAKRSIKQLMDGYGFDNVEAVGVFDGINESLETPLTLDDYTEESDVDFTVILPALYLNMLKVKATWLSSLEEWDAVLTQEKRREIKKEYVDSITAKSQKTAGRNDPCPCGSGKKYKKCCGQNE